MSERPDKAKNDRTTPLGLFNYARSYWQSGVKLHAAKVKVSHPDAPITLLLAHAIELYLKSFLRLRGVGVEEVKASFGHDFKRLADKAASLGLAFMDEDREVAMLLTEKESIRRSRYIETGYFMRPSLAALSRTCLGLDASISASLREGGINVRSAKLDHIETD